MKTKVGIISALLLLSSTMFLSAVEVSGWAIRFCKKNIEAPTIKLKIGVPGDKDSQMYWMTWTSNQDEVIAVPDKFKDVKAIWVGVETDPPRKAVHVCLQYNGNNTKKWTFNGDGETESEQANRADCDCK